MKRKRRKGKKGKKALATLIQLIVLPIIISLIFSWREGLGFFGLVFIWKIIKMLKRGYFIKDRRGKKVGFRKFFKRWKTGIEGITPLQQARTTLLGMWIVISGLVGGIAVTSIVRISHVWWWMLIILSGSLIVTSISLIGAIQKYWRFKEQDKIQKQFERDLKKFK